MSRPKTDKEKRLDWGIKFNRAAEGDNVNKVRKFLSQAREVPSWVLTTAIANKYFKVAELLLAESNVSFFQRTLDSSLCTAIRRGNEPLAEKLLGTGANPNARDGLLKDTPLILAARRGFVGLVGKLIAKKADLNAQNASIASQVAGNPLGKTPLMEAAEKGDARIAELLISRGAEVNARGESGFTALDICCRSKKRRAVEALIRKAGGLPGKQLSLSKRTSSGAKRFVGVSDKLPRRPGLQAAAKYLVQRFSLTKSSHPTVKGVLLLSESKTEERQCRKKPDYFEAIIESVSQQLSEKGLHAFVTWDRTLPPCIALAKASDSLEFVEMFQTANANYGVTNRALQKFLRDLHRKHPLRVVGCGPTFVNCRFSRPLERAGHVAEKLFKFCAFVAHEHRADVSAFARHLEQTGKFSIWWD